jgi:hypothetical protein
MKSTLLEMTQEILSAQDSDEVNSITDTVESVQVALLLKSVYYDIITDLRPPEHDTLVQLLASGDNLKPCLMTHPSNVEKIFTINYDNKADADTYPNYVEVRYKPFTDFFMDQQGLREDTTGVGSQVIVHNGQDFTFLFRDDKDPQYYTTADDDQIIFDSYDSTKDTTLQQSKTMCTATTYPVWLHQDDFTPDLDAQFFPFYKNRAKVRAFNELKQQVNQEAAGEARRQKIIVQKRKRKTPGRPEVYNVASRFGRK